MSKYWDDRKSESATERLNHPSLFDAYASMITQGITSTGGSEMIIFAWHDKRVILPREECLKPIPHVMAMLAERGIALIGKEGVDYLQKAIPTVWRFPPSECLDRPGFDGTSYGHLNGDVDAPAGTDYAHAGYRAFPLRHHVRGSAKRWHRDVGQLLDGQMLAQFSGLMPFAIAAAEVMAFPGPLALEIVGHRNASLSIIQSIAASVQGSICSGPISFRSLADDPDTVLAEHRGTLAIIGDPGYALAAETPARRQTIILGVLRALQRTDGGPKGCLIAGEKSLVEWAGRDSDVGKLAAEQLVTLSVPADRPFGAFDHVDAGGVAALNLALSKAVQAQHGTPFRAFSAALVQASADDKVAMTKWFEAKIARFIRATRIDPHDIVNTHRARFFGLVFAAGLWALNNEIMSLGSPCSRIVIGCWRQFHPLPPALRPVPVILNEIACTALRLDSDPRPRRRAIEEAHALIRGQGAQRKLFLKTEALASYPELHARLYEPVARSLLIAPDPVQSRQRLGAAGIKRVYAFRVPEGEVAED